MGSNDFRGKSNLIETRDLMRENHIQTTPLNLDIYSRDLTINMMIYSLEDGRVYDVTKQANADLHAKILRTYFDAESILPRNPLIILRVLKYANRYGFTIDPALDKALLKYKDLLFDGRFHAQRLVYGLNDILREGKTDGLKKIKAYGLEPLLSVRKLWLKQENNNASTNPTH